MTYLAHSAHAQLGALWLGFVGWTLTAVSLGLIQWRVWLVSDRDVISSGLAWVGIWRTCFHSNTLVTPGFLNMHCRYLSLTEAFTPPEIVAGQVLMLLSLLVGLCGNAGGVYAMRNVYFGMEKNSPIRLAFYTAGTLCLLAAVMSLIPLVWNLSSVVTNQTIKFPPDFNMPQAPDSQQVGCGIGVGLVGTVLLFVSGIIFCQYRLPVRSQRPESSLPALPAPSHSARGRDNSAFVSDEHL
ncbi:claudin-34-like [Centropristis striata]|uniref:claudin-34-like n=1 Tax=Centropristis striata TaxID=184440 RepID=UPI0027DF6589|nr:claudin-34-like [Centropristis striata]